MQQTIEDEQDEESEGIEENYSDEQFDKSTEQEGVLAPSTADNFDDSLGSAAEASQKKMVILQKPALAPMSESALM